MRACTLISLVLLAVSPTVAAHGPKREHRAPPRVHFDAAVVNDPLTIDEVTPGYRGNAAVRGQILLDRAHFSPAEIDGRYGDNLRVALLGYQADRKLAETGNIDAATWQSLNNDKEPPLVAYTITEGDLKGPFEAVPAQMEDQAKLPSLGYSSPQEMFGERFHISPALLELLNPGKDLTKAGEEIMAPNVHREYPPPKAEKVVVKKSTRTVTAYMADDRIIFQFPATIGSEHDPLPIGDWNVKLVSRNPTFYYNPKLFWDAKADSAAAKIPPGPNNPVGVIWIGLSKEHYGIHGTPNPSRIGHSESHGCVRLTNWDAAELGQAVAKGTPVIMQE